MQSPKLSALIFAVMSLSVILAGSVGGKSNDEEKEWVVLHDGVSPQFQRYSIPLKFSKSSSTIYSSPSSNFVSKSIDKDDSKCRYTQRLDYGKRIDGYEYFAAARDASDVKFLNARSGNISELKLMRSSEGGEAVTLEEGFMFLQNDASIKITICPKKLVVPTEEQVEATLRLSLSSSNPPVYVSNFRITVNGTVSGSLITEEALIEVSMTFKDSPQLVDRYVSLTIKPFDDNMAVSSVGGKISEVLAIGSGKMIVEKIAADGSEVVIALVQGSLVKAKEVVKKPESPLDMGEAFPDFSRIDLVSRSLVTLDDLQKEAGEEGHIALVFGNFKRPRNPNYGGMPQINKLSLDEGVISETIMKDVTGKVVIAFICRDFPLWDLYEKWLGEGPGFYILSDFSDPSNLNMSASGMQRVYYGRPSQSETLGGQLMLPQDKVVCVLINGAGELAYLNTDAGGELSKSLVEMNQLIRSEGKCDKKGCPEKKDCGDKNK